MEHSGKFDLVEAVSDLVQVINEGQLSDRDEQELRDHILEEVRNLQLLGLSSNESFVIAKMRFGDKDLMQQEFRKIRPVFTLNQLVLKAIFLFISLSMVFALSPYLSFISATLFSSLVDTSPTIFLLGDLGIKGIFITGGFYSFYYLIFRRPRMNLDFYIAALIIYILIAIIIYFNFGHLPLLEPQLQKPLWKNSIQINSLAMFFLIFYNLYLMTKEDNSESAIIQN